MKIEQARTVLTCPGPQLRHRGHRDRRRRARCRRRHAQRPRARRGQLPRRPRAAATDRPRCPVDRGHLALPVQGRLLAPRPGDDDGDRRRRHGAVGHQGQESRHARVQPARWTGARRGDRVRPRQRGDDRRGGRSRRPLRGGRLQGGAGPVRVPGPRPALRRRPRRPVLRAGRDRPSDPRDVRQRAVPARRAQAVRAVRGQPSGGTSSCSTTSTIA